MAEIIKNKTYFFLTKSVFKDASRGSATQSFKFLQKSVMIRVLHRDKINPHIVFYPQDAVDDIKTEFGERFESIFQIGENMFYPEYNPKIKGNINDRVLSYAVDMDGEIPNTDKVKIVYADKETAQHFSSRLRSGGYPVTLISVDDALKEMAALESEFHNGRAYAENHEEHKAQ